MFTASIEARDAIEPEAVPICGLCCLITSIYTVWPECFGIDIKMIFCCLEFDCRYCKFRNPNNDRPDRPDQCFILSDGTNSCVKPKTLVRGYTRLCCLNQRCAIPMDDEVPCLFNICGLSLFYKGVSSIQCCGNFMKLEELAYKGL